MSEGRPKSLLETIEETARRSGRPPPVRPGRQESAQPQPQPQPQPRPAAAGKPGQAGQKAHALQQGPAGTARAGSKPAPAATPGPSSDSGSPAARAQLWFHPPLAAEPLNPRHLEDFSALLARAWIRKYQAG